MKLNNKGVTLVELIVSFALVSVAVIYFYQTLSTVRKIYKTATVETQEFINKSYELKLAYANKIEDEGNDICSEEVDNVTLYYSCQDSTESGGGDTPLPEDLENPNPEDLDFGVSDPEDSDLQLEDEE